MKNRFVVSLFFLFVWAAFFASCQDAESHYLSSQPILKIDKILIDGVEYAYADTIKVNSANRVEIDYTVESESDIAQIQNIYLYGGAANNIKTETNFPDSRKFSGKLICDDFLPFLCSFRVVGVDKNAGLCSDGFVLKLPFNGFKEIVDPANKGLFVKGNFDLTDVRSVQPNNAGTAFYQVNDGNRRRWDHVSHPESDWDKSVCENLGFAFAEIDKNITMLSPSIWNEKIGNSINAVIMDNAPVSYFTALPRFTKSMWDQINNYEQLEYLKTYPFIEKSAVVKIESEFAQGNIPDQYFLVKTGKSKIGLVRVYWVGILNGYKKFAFNMKTQKY